MQFKKTYSFAFWSALPILLISLFLVALNYFYLFDKFGVLSFFISLVIFFFLVFFIIQRRAELFIYRRIKKIYDEVSLLDVSDLNKKSITTDLETLSKSVKDFVKDKQIEIAHLTERDSFRKDFLGNVSHELKTPLFTVQGYILTLLEGAINNKEIRTKYLQRASNGVDRLTAIVKDLDMIAKLEMDGLKMNKSTFNILELIQKVIDLLEMKAKKRNITLHFNQVYEFPIFVNADKERIEQVLINLIVNAINYGKNGGVTTLSIENFDTDKVLVKVADNGEGIKQQHLARLFERFYRVDRSRSREQGGSGLGLSIVKHIVEAHNETILLKSTFGEGSEFSFTLEKAK